MFQLTMYLHCSAASCWGQHGPLKKPLTNKGNDWHKDLLTEIDQVKRELACPSYREIKMGSWLLEQCFGEKIYSLWCKRDNQNIIFEPIKGYFFFLHFKKSSSLMSRFLIQIRKKMRHIFSETELKIHIWKRKKMTPRERCLPNYDTPCW